MKWAIEFKRRRESIGNDQYTRRPGKAMTSENYAAVKRLPMVDQRFKLRQVAETLDIQYIATMLKPDCTKSLTYRMLRSMGTQIAHICAEGGSG